MLMGLAAAALTLTASPALAAAGSGPRLPPLDRGTLSWEASAHACNNRSFGTT